MKSNGKENPGPSCGSRCYSVMKSHNEENPARSCSKFRIFVQLTCLYVPVKIWNSEELTSDQITLKFYEVFILEEMARDMKPSVISGKDTKEENGL